MRQFEYRLTLDFPKDVRAPDGDILSDYTKSEVIDLVKAFFRAEHPTVTLVKSDGQGSSASFL